MRVSTSLRSAVFGVALVAVTVACNDTAADRNGLITGTQPVASREFRVE